MARGHHDGDLYGRESPGGVGPDAQQARKLLLLSTVATTVLGAMCLVLEDFVVQMVCLSLLGVGLATFFNSFQTFMRGETVPGALASTVAHYTLAWSAGSSLGFLSSGVVYRMGTLALGAVDVAVGLTVLAILLQHQYRDHEEASADEHVEQPMHGARGQSIRRTSPLPGV